ncbi:MaoC family dehydratase N-terminal domain-containing protein [Ornithinimicrobium faecis]|uniref:MaoC family dehydratase N-terminal domain-containing protein n=1 Tax=Ornithinimicrobium faecis TaxID=2934158 RepID=A0ABY4YVS6_9MICO|nr:MaoC family dehydratase N-terminal domain-containing protein [Ornithinimicrobium sp. HY1793]USQ80876.1 MaoC family dehydratase N-terminal domain-containing protein [Ornithinimicrobium sp. HY1793]
MAVNPDYAGREYPPVGPFPVTAEEIAAFADAIGSTSAAHRDPAAAQALGHADVVAPPTFAVRLAQQCEAQLIRDEDAGIDFSRVVHGEESFTHHRPITAGDSLSGVLHVDRIREAGGHGMVSTRVELSDARGAPVTTVKSTIVVRGGG